MRVRPGWTIATLAAVVAGGSAAAVAAGLGAAAIAAPDPPVPQPASRVVHAGPVVMTVPVSWRHAAPIAELDGSPATVLTNGSSERVVVVFGPADGRSLLPRALRVQVDSPLPWSRDASLAGRPAIAYGRVHAGDLSLDVTALPTSAGILAVACPHSDGQRSDCGSGIKDVSVPGAIALVPSPAIPAAAQLPAAIARLDGATVAGRAELAAAGTPAAQAAAAARLASRHRATAEELRSAFGVPVAGVAAALDRSADGYDALGAAAAAGSPGAFAAARADIRTAETALSAAVDTVIRDGTRPSRNPAPAPPAAAPAEDTPGSVQLAEVLLVTLLLLASVAAGFVSSGPVLRAAARAARRLSAPT
jgi:hypothetical protein